jgi:hypothetical protein
MKASLAKDGKVVIEFDLGSVDEEILSFLSGLEISRKSKAKDEEIYNLAIEIKRNWWLKNKRRFISDENCAG